MYRKVAYLIAFVLLAMMVSSGIDLAASAKHTGERMHRATASQE